MCVDTSNCTWGLYKHCKWYTESWPGDKILATLDSHTHVSIAPGFLVHPLTLTSVTCPQDLLLRFHCPSSLPDMNCLFVCLFVQTAWGSATIHWCPGREGWGDHAAQSPAGPTTHVCPVWAVEFGETADHAVPRSAGHFVVFLSLERQVTTLYQGHMAILLSCVPCMGCGVWRDSWPHCTKVRWPFCCLS